MSMANYLSSQNLKRNSARLFLVFFEGTVLHEAARILYRQGLSALAKAMFLSTLRFGAHLFLIVFRGTVFHRAARVAYRQGPGSVFKIAYRKLVARIKFKVGVVHNPPFHVERMKFSLPERLPRISVIAVLYKKEKELNYFLKSFEEQSYEGELEIVLVDDCSPDKGVEQARKFRKRVGSISKGKLSIDVKLLQNSENLGNCDSRLKGIDASSGEIVIVMDADCVVNKDFLKAHAEAYANGDCDVAVGPMNIETNHHNPIKYRDSLEQDFSRVFQLMALQDKINGRSFLNCVTRNFSIRRDFITEPLFDSEFSYSTKSDSGFGWEDVEMGYRLYKRGARIKFLNKSFALHVTHPSSIGENEKALKCLKNFRKLFDKHPELIVVARRWSLETYSRIQDWLTRSQIEHSNDQKALELRFKPHIRHRLAYQPQGYRILTYRWHVPHQYELYKLPHQFTLATGIVNNFTTAWAFDQRPMPANARFQPIQKIKEKTYDYAILHFDENVLDWQNTNNVLDTHWGANFRYFLENVNLPKVAICHGTPQFYGQYNNPNVTPSELMKVIEPARVRLVEALKDVLVICNSYQAQAEWGFKKSKVIWQGFDPLEYQPALYQSGILTLGNAMKERPHYRGYEVFKSVFRDFPTEWMPKPFVVQEPSYEKNTNAYANAKYTNFVNSIRTYSMYFNPTVRSPMPRSRGESMMCGLTTVSLQNHDVDLFIRNGINGFYSSNPEELREYLLFLLKNPAANRRIGQAGRATSLDLFNHDRYMNEWTRTLESL
jgi:glycosyltransferase involved in cell wall biosynthesis